MTDVLQHPPRCLHHLDPLRPAGLRARWPFRLAHVVLRVIHLHIAPVLSLVIPLALDGQWDIGLKIPVSPKQEGS